MQLSALTASLGRFLAELQRRKVLRIAAAYVVGAWIVLQVALALQTAMSLSGQFSAAILALLVIGFFVTIVLSWFYEITPEGVKRTAPATGDAPLVKPQTADLALAGALTLVVIVALAQLLTASPTTSPATPATTTAEATPAKPEPPALGDKSIAVLPFANLSPDKENEYFADGLTEELLNLLAKIGDLKVISRTSSFAFKGKNTPLPEIAKQLGVRHIVEGTVRGDLEKVRVTAQLIDVTTDTHLWSDTFDRKLQSAFFLQEEIAVAIGSALKVELAISGSRKAPTKSVEAYRLFLKAKARFFRRSKGDLLESVELCKQAIAIDPKFAEAYAWLATSYVPLSARSAASFKELAPVARQAARTALALKPNLGRAYGAIGQLARSDFAWAEAIANLSKAAVLDPSDPVGASALGYALFIVGEHQHAERLFVEAQRLDPIAHSVAALVLAFSAFNRGDDDTAKSRAEWLTHSVSEADRAIGQTLLAAIARSEGNYAEAEDRFRIAASLSHRSQELADALAQAIKTRAAIPSARAALMKEATRDPTFEPELLLILIGDNEGFFDAVDARLAKGDKVRTMNYIAMAWRVFSSGDSANARFKVLMRKVGLVDYWKKHGWPDRCRAKGEDDFECS